VTLPGKRWLATALLSVVPLVPLAAQPATGTVGHGPPDTMVGLDVKKEDVAKVLATDKRALYVDRVGLYSFREQSKLLQATLEIAHFRSGTPSNTQNFQLSVVGNVGSSVPIIVRVGDKPVYVTTKKGLLIAIWFKDDYMIALAIRNTYKQPKQLLRQALEINP
jgi:hypothetical protein